MPYGSVFTIDGVVFAYLAGICVPPASSSAWRRRCRCPRTNVNGEILKEGGRGTGRRRGCAASTALVVLELALTLVLLVGAGLMVRSFMALHRLDLGHQPDHLVTMRSTCPSQLPATPEARAQFFERLDPAAGRALPGVDTPR